MLVLRRKAGEAIVLNGTITIHVLAVEGERVKLGINAPADVVIVRSELLEGQSSGPNGSMPGAPVPPREPRPYTYRDPDSQRPYRDREPGDNNNNSSGERESSDPRRTAPNGANGMNGNGMNGNGMYGGPPRYTPPRRMYDDQPAAPAPVPNTNPRYR